MHKLDWESSWWGTCQNTYGEESKQILYASRMGLKSFHNGKSPYNFDLQNFSVLDIGGGPVSLLLKCINVKGKVVDPLKYPDWVYQRYQLSKINFEIKKGEDVIETGFDEVWIYNCLQHTEDPIKILENAKRAGKIIRLFEWINTPKTEGHPHSFTSDFFDKQLNGIGKTEILTGQYTCKGSCYYGIFKGNNYA